MPDMLRVALLISPGAGYDRGLLRGIARYARHCGCWTFLPYWDQGLPEEAVWGQSTPTSQQKVLGNRSKSMSQQLKRLGVTGIIGRFTSPQIVRSILASKLPAIGMDLSDEQLADPQLAASMSEIRPDSYKAGRMAAEHLLERGFRRFAFCGVSGSPNWSRLRGEGFCQRLAEAGFGCDVYQAPHSRSSPLWHREYPAIRAWLQTLPKPVGIMACNDIRGRQVLEVCALGKMHVPNDVAVIGCDEDQVLSELSNPPLSSIALNGEQGGYQAAEVLHQMMLGRIKEPQRIVVEPLWVTARVSTDVVAIEDRDVAEVVRYIRENARRPIQIMDIVKRTGISRRALEIRFHRTLGWSIREEIERIRIELVKQLLAETDLPTWKIAANAGFSGEEYLGKVFRRVTATTMALYRRQHQTT